MQKILGMRSRAPTCAEPAKATDPLYLYPGRDRRILDAAGNLRHQKPNPLRRQLYVMLFGLIAAAGLRVSEALHSNSTYLA